MNSKLKIVRLFGIDVFLHWTFFFFLIYVVFNVQEGNSLGEILYVLSIVLLFFAFITMHELGHSLAARRFGIKTNDIILTPIGGIARLTYIPQNPKQELVIAIAGPLVNVGIAIIFYLVGVLLFGYTNFTSSLWNVDEQLLLGLQEFMLIMVWWNSVMVLFNLLPSFPMDGGRILRATLAFFMPHKLATTIAASVGVAFAIVFIAYALLGQNINYGLVFLGVFVLLAANSEGNLLGQIKRKLGLYNINEFIRQDTFVLYENEPLETVIDYFKQSSKKTSLVYNGLHQIVGIFDLNNCIQNANSISEFSLVKDIMIRHWPLINFHDTVKNTLLKLNEYNLDYVPVYYKNNYIGTLNKNDIV